MNKEIKQKIFYHPPGNLERVKNWVALVETQYTIVGQLTTQYAHKTRIDQTTVHYMEK